MDLREVPDASLGTLVLQAKPLDVSFVSGRWVGAGADELNGALHTRRLAGPSEHDALSLLWPRRIYIRSINKATVEIRRAIVASGRTDVTQEQADVDAAAAWPESERQAIIPTVQPFAIVALEGAKIVGELLVEAQ